MGESGCGKSTLGRTLLQLYKQTDGRTMYYGRNLLDVAPKYMAHTVKNLESLRKRRNALREELARSEAAYEKMAEDARIRAAGELQDLRRRANNADLDITNIVGGLIDREDLGPVKAAYLKLYEAALKRREIRAKMALNRTQLADAQYRAEHGRRGAAEAADRIRGRGRS